MLAEADDERRLSFERIFRSNYRAVEGFIAGQFPNADTADVLSVTFTTAWRRFDEMPVDAAKGWLFGIARNTALNSLRGFRRRRARLDAYQAVRPPVVTELHDHDLAPDTVEALRAALDQLSEADREIVLLAGIHGLSGDDLAAAVGTSPGTAAVRLHRARRRLEAHLGERGQHG